MGTLRKFFNGVFGKKSPKVKIDTPKKQLPKGEAKKVQKRLSEKSKGVGFLLKLSNNRKQTKGRRKKITPYSGKSGNGAPIYFPKHTKLKGYMRENKRKSA
jgi:hypothetical protein